MIAVFSHKNEIIEVKSTHIITFNGVVQHIPEPTSAAL
jgi:hypothetical protein